MPNYESFKLFRILADEIKQIDSNPKSQQIAYLVPFRMLSISGFKFPFSNPVRIREAIKLQTVSYSGGNPIQIFPAIVNKGSKETSGFSFFLPDSELIELEKVTENPSSPILPAPLSLASCVDGNGITVWTDEKNICSVIWRLGVPELYRWSANRESALASEINWLKKFCDSKEIEEKNEVFIFDAENDSEKLLPIIKQSFTSFPWLKEINLSRGAINSAMILERFVRFSSKAAIWLTVFGSIFLAGAWMNYSTVSKALAETRSSSSKLYREVFDKEVRIEDTGNLISLARAKITTLKGSGTTGKTLSDVLSDLGFPMKDKQIRVSLDNLSYNIESANLEGTAADMNVLQSFRSSLNELGATVSLGNVQQTSGGEYRFNITIRWQ
jgi:hypothetical protein